MRKLKTIICNIYILCKYGLYKNVSIHTQRRLTTIFELSISKKANVSIDRDLLVNKNVAIRVRENAKLTIGKNVFFNNNCIVTCRKKITIGNNVIFGPNVCVFDHDHNYKSNNRNKEYILGEITIGDNVWLGANACILRGSEIGNNSVIAAGAIVKGKVAPNMLYFSKENQKEIECNQDE